MNVKNKKNPKNNEKFYSFSRTGFEPVFRTGIETLHVRKDKRSYSRHENISCT